MATNSKKSPKNKNTTNYKKSKSVAKKQNTETKDILIQVGLALYFTVYFIAHHFLSVYNTRWIFYLSIAALVFYIIKHRNKKQEKFAEGFCFYKVFLLYVIGCMIGVYYEEILTFCRTGAWLSRQGIIYGPFNPVYGLGFLAFTVLLCRNLKRKWWLTYIYACFIGGAAEVITSLISEYVFKVNAWDYSDMFLNIMGRTTVPFMLFWGAGGLIFVKLVYPGFSKLIELIPKRIGNLIMPTFIIFVLLSHVISYTALFRYGTRSEGAPATNDIEDILDEYYDDNLMKQYYDNSVHEKIGD